MIWVRHLCVDLDFKSGYEIFFYWVGWQKDSSTGQKKVQVRYFEIRKETEYRHRYHAISII